MGIIYLLLFFSLIIAVGFLWAFLWSNNNGQFEDLEGPAMRILREDKQPKSSTNS